MNHSQLGIGFERKIGYSFLGLMAGNVASTVLLLLIAVLPRLGVFAGIGQFWKLDIGEALGFAFVVWIFSMAGWVVVGLPVVFLLRAEIAADFYWITAALTGVVLGAFAMALIYVVPNPRHISIAVLWNIETLKFFSLAALIAGVAFTVYCSLVNAALRREAKESGAPSGTPRSLAWFDF
jgi:hypothetical protein